MYSKNKSLLDFKKKKIKKTGEKNLKKMNRVIFFFKK